MHSMTGFGRGEHIDSQVCYRVEVSSVNRKHADVVIGIPRPLVTLEPKIKERLLERVSRGRITISIHILPLATSTATTGLRINHALAADYLAGLRELAAIAPDIQLDIHAGDLLRAPGIFALEEDALQPEAAWQGIQPALDQAIEELIATRKTEGTNLRIDLEARIDRLEQETTAAIKDLAATVVEHYRTQLAERLKHAGLPLPMDDERLIREIALFAEKSDITEELTRLASHLKKFRELIKQTQPTGRSLDFFSQELSREFNTIGSKAHSAAIAQLVVQGKTEVEKIREQVQNIE
jgi:uncharacterized protein (TIGR00255 family)